MHSCQKKNIKIYCVIVQTYNYSGKIYYAASTGTQIIKVRPGHLISLPVESHKDICLLFRSELL